MLTPAFGRRADEVVVTILLLVVISCAIFSIVSIGTRLAKSCFWKLQVTFAVLKLTKNLDDTIGDLSQFKSWCHKRNRAIQCKNV